MNKYWIFLVLALTLSIQAFGQTTMTFDEFNAPIFGNFPSPYLGFNISGTGDFGVINGLTYCCQPTGYHTGIVSGTNVAYSINPFTISRGTDFTFNDGYFTAAWNNGENFQIQGFSGNTLLDSQDFTINASGPLHIVLNWSGIDKLVFTGSGGVPSGDPGAGSYFAMDNLSFDQTPEPGGIVLLGSGLLGVAGVLRRKIMA